MKQVRKNSRGKHNGKTVHQISAHLQTTMALLHLTLT
jgi:hypothetical protein